MHEPFRTLKSHIFPLLQDNIDTDQIIPARFLTTTAKQGLGRAAFYDWRFDGDGRERADHALHKRDASRHQILLAGNNFGCGSSREHAAWALRDFGVRAVLSTNIADIFSGNALRSGILPIRIDPKLHAEFAQSPDLAMEIDLEQLELRFAGRAVAFDVEPFARFCLLQGKDAFGWLMDHLPQFEAFEAERA